MKLKRCNVVRIQVECCEWVDGDECMIGSIKSHAMQTYTYRSTVDDRRRALGDSMTKRSSGEAILL